MGFLIGLAILIFIVYFLINYPTINNTRDMLNDVCRQVNESDIALDNKINQLDCKIDDLNEKLNELNNQVDGLQYKNNAD